MLGIAIAVVAVAGNCIVYGIGSGREFRLFNSPIFFIPATAWVTSSLGLFAIWLGIGRGWLFLRLLVVGAVAAILVLIFGGGWHAEAFADFVLFLVAAALPFGLLYIFGFHVQHIKQMQDAAVSHRQLRKGQFSLQQLLGWSVAATLVASVGRFAQIGPREWVGFGVTTGIFSCIAVGAVCAALLPGQPATVVIRLCILGGSTIGLTCATVILMSGRGPGGADELAYLAFGSLAHVSLMSLALLLFRRLGYRLQR